MQSRMLLLAKVHSFEVSTAAACLLDVFASSFADSPERSRDLEDWSLTFRKKTNIYKRVGRKRIWTPGWASSYLAIRP